jgi:hypothetical protein
VFYEEPHGALGELAQQCPAVGRRRRGADLVLVAVSLAEDPYESIAERGTALRTYVYRERGARLRRRERGRWTDDVQLHSRRIEKPDHEERASDDREDVRQDSEGSLAHDKRLVALLFA